MWITQNTDDNTTFIFENQYQNLSSFNNFDNIYFSKNNMNLIFQNSENNFKIKRQAEIGKYYVSEEK